VACTNTTDKPEVVVIVEEVEDKVMLEMPYIGPLAYPENLEGWDTVEERLIAYEEALNTQLEGIDTLVQQKYQNFGKSAYTAFYTAFWQDKLNDYARGYSIIGSRPITDSGGDFFGNCSA
jgi:hypothetical protein